MRTLLASLTLLSTAASAQEIGLDRSRALTTPGSMDCSAGVARTVPMPDAGRPVPTLPLDGVTAVPMPNLCDEPSPSALVENAVYGRPGWTLPRHAPETLLRFRERPLRTPESLDELRRRPPESWLRSRPEAPVAPLGGRE